MRPRIKLNWNISRIELDKWLIDNRIYGFVVDSSHDKVFIYKSFIMYRDNKKSPEILYMVVSRQTKMVLDVYTDNYKFKSLEDLKNKLSFKY